MSKNSIETTDFRGFPKGYQYRPHTCREFTRVLATDSETNVLCIEARPGIGASSLCAEIFESLDGPAILLIVEVGSRAGYSIPILLSQAVRQASLQLGLISETSGQDSSVGDWHNLLMKLQRRARSTRQQLHLIIDGLYQIPTEDRRYLQDVIKDVLSLGVAGIAHVITWREDSKLPDFLHPAVTRRISVPALSEIEAENYLLANGIAGDVVKEIILSTACVPAKLASVVRLSKHGALDVTKIRASLSEYYELEWQALLSKSGITTSELESVFAFLVYSKRHLSITELAGYSGVSVEALHRILPDSGFVRTDEIEVISPSSNTHRNFLTEKLFASRDYVIGKFVDALVVDASSPDAVQLLPSYYQELGRDNDIVAVLTPANLDSYLGETQSLTALRRRTELGFNAAIGCKMEVEAYRFSLQTSVVRSLELSDENEPRLAALAATDRLDEALHLAMGGPTKEGRLVLLAQYANALFTRGIQVDQTIADGISSLIRDVDLTADRERALAIAEQLVGPLPDQSIAIVEQSSGGAKDYQDAAFMHIVLKSQKQANGPQASVEKYRTRIADSDLQGFLRATEAVYGEKSADEIRNATTGFDGRQRSFFLRLWIRSHTTDPAALDIADYALDEVARDTAYLPTAADLMDICLPLAEAGDLERAKSILGRIEIQQSSLLDFSPTIDKYRLELEIARAKTALDMADPEDALGDIFLRMGYLEDDGVRLECFAWMRSKIEQFSHIPPEIVALFRKLLNDSIQETTEKCLSTTAEHLDVFRGAVTALAESSPQQALGLIATLNIQDRRDKGYRLFAEKLVSRRSVDPIEVALLMRALNSIVAKDIRWAAIFSCLSLVANRKPMFDKKPTGLIALGQAIEDPLGRTLAFTKSILIEKHYGIVSNLEETLSKFDEVINNIDQRWMVPDVCFKFIEAIASVDKNVASKRLSSYQKELHQRPVCSPEYARLIFELGRLTVVSFAGTLKHKFDSDESLMSVVSVIEESASAVQRATLYSDLAMRAYTNGRKDILDKVCEQRLLPLIRGAESEHNYICQRVIECSFVALHLYNQSVSNNLLKIVEKERQDDCRQEAVLFYVTGHTTHEPHDDESFRSAKVTWGSATTAVDLITAISTDNAMVSSVQNLVNACLAKASMNEISTSQRAGLAGRILEKVTRDLPDLKNIQHKGWQIVAKSLCFKLKDEQSADKWKQLIAEAESVPNISDSVYVLSSIAPCFPSKFSVEKLALMKEAERRLGLIPSKVDKIRRSISMSSASFTAETENAIAKRLLIKAMKDSLLMKDGEAATEAQRDIIDQAYQIDKDFAEELVELIDDDPARTRALMLAKERLKTHKAKGAMLDKRYDELGLNVNDIGAVCWQMLGGLNANKQQAQRQEEIGRLMDRVLHTNIQQSIGFYWWYLRNLQFKYQHNAGQSKTALAPLFEVTRLAALLTIKLGNRICGNGSTVVDMQTTDHKNLLIASGSRELAYAHIKSWLDQCTDKDILLCDPYFKPRDIDFIKDLFFHKDDLSFSILTCTSEITSGDLDAEYGAAWADIAHVEPPPLKIVHVYFDGGKSKSTIHDRWLLCGDSGLRIGTSVGSIGMSKLSELSHLAAGEAAEVRRALSPFLVLSERWLEGKKLKYRVVQW
jgi:hypothetical protein